MSRFVRRTSLGYRDVRVSLEPSASVSRLNGPSYNKNVSVVDLPIAERASCQQPCKEERFRYFNKFSISETVGRGH